jgi:hypothetical protein
MDLFDFLWNVSQERQLEELRGRLDQVRLEHDLAGGDRKMKELADENLELKLRLGLLVRLLISEGVITAQEYAALIAESRPQVVRCRRRTIHPPHLASHAIQVHRASAPPPREPAAALCRSAIERLFRCPIPDWFGSQGRRRL